jgi:concentrative nucleoside transporter, CNT family
MTTAQALLGILVLTAFAWLISENRRKVRVRDIVTGLALQFFLAALILKVPLFRQLFEFLNGAVVLLEASTKAGTTFVFGYLGGGPLPFDPKTPGSSFVFALQALPVVLVISALSSLLFYWRILPVVVRAFSRVLERTMGIGGAVGLGAAANVFFGMVEAPLVIRPYLRQMTRSELFITMSCGMAGIAGTVMVLYAAILRNIIPDALGHILLVSVISIPAAIMISRIMIPEDGTATAGDRLPPSQATGAMDAITLGTLEGVQLLIGIIAMLIVLVALVHLVNGLFAWLPGFGGEPVTLQGLLGYAMAPVVWLIGIPWAEARTAGALMGTKTVLNELIAYLDMAKLPPGTLSPKSLLIMTYALCGFANLGSLGIMIGGMGAMVPDRRAEIVSLGFKSILSGTLATCMTGAIVGIIL